MEPSKIKTTYRVSCTNCSVVGCHNNYSNTDPSVSFYSFPSRPHEKQRRTQWINAIRRNRHDKHPWEPKPYSKICSQHFVRNKKSNHPASPAYVPTIFPECYNKVVADTKSKNERFEGHVKRTTIYVESSDVPHSEHIEPLPLILNVIEEKKNCSTQVNFTSNIENSFLFECEYYNNGEIATSCNIIPTSNIKKFVEKSVGPNSSEDNTCIGFHGSSSIKTDEQLISLTSVRFTVFTHILGLLSSIPHGHEKITIKDKLLIFLIKMKLGVSYSAVGVLFGVHRSTIQRIFTLLLEQLSQKMKNYVFWPTKDVIQQSMPEAFKRNYPTCRVIIDCSKIKIQQPGPVDHRIYTYSHYKGTFTAKFLIGISPCGFISFISSCYGGRSSDGFITNDCGILELLEKGDLCLADKGFPGVKCEDVIIVMPPFVHDGRLTEEEVEKTYSVASVRIHVERAIQRVKTHNILNNITHDMFSIIDEIVFMCCVLANLQTPIIKNDVKMS